LITTTLRVENIGLRTWETQGPNSVFLGYHWLNADGDQIYIFDDLRTPLPHTLAPGESVELQARLRAPGRSGNYILAWDMVRGDLFWFSVFGWPMHQVSLNILPGDQGVGYQEKAVQNVLPDLNIDRLTLWRGALKMLATHPLLGVGPGNFRLMFGSYLNRAFWDQRMHANNTYLEMFADMGILGGVTFLFLIVASLRVAWRGLRISEFIETSIWLATLTAALAAFLIHGIIDYFLEFMPTALLFWMILALLVSVRSSQRSGLSSWFRRSSA
jgi:hypothetical protein